MNRYTISFKDNTIEPDDAGKWVKYAEVADIEASAQIKAEESAAQSMQAEREALDEAQREIRAQHALIEGLNADLADARQTHDGAVSHHARVLKAASERLKLHGHHPNCESRYSAISADGQATVGNCNCGLDEWFKEAGLHG